MQKLSSRSFRNLALTGASVVALAGAAVGVTAAGAANNSYDLALGLYLSGSFTAPSPVASGTSVLLSELNDQIQVGGVSATVLSTGIELNWNAGVWSGEGEGEVGHTEVSGSGSGNSIFATAKGNEAVGGTVLGLELLGADDSAAVLSAQTIVTSPVRAVIGEAGAADPFALGGEIHADVYNVVGADSVLAVTGNDITATATLNQSTPNYLVSGRLAPDQGSDDPGSSSVSFTDDADLGITTTATVAITNVQVALDSGQNAPGDEEEDIAGGSLAAVYGSRIRLSDELDAGSLDPADLGPEDDGDFLGVSISSTLSLDDNSIEANFTGNLAQNRFLAESGDGSLFSGSLAITSGQLNLDTTPNGEVEAILDEDDEVIGHQFVHSHPNFVAVVADSQIITTLYGAKEVTIEVEGENGPQNIDVNVVAGFDGVLSVSDNTIGAAMVGNQALSSAMFEEGISIQGAGGLTKNALGYPTVLGGEGQLEAEVAADISILNVQSNLGSFFGARVDDNVIGADIEAVLPGAEISIDGNAILAEARGNVSSNQVLADGHVIDATVAVGNFQTNDSVVTFVPYDPNDPQGDGEWVEMPFVAVAVNRGSEIGGRFGFATELDGQEFLTDQSGTVSVSGNAIAATAKGNLTGNASLSTPTIALSATVLNADAGDGLAMAFSDGTTNEVIGGIAVEGGITASNLQSNFGADSEVTAIVNDATIAIEVVYLEEGGQTDLLFPLSMTDGIYVVDDNLIAAEARGNEAYTQVLLTGVAGGEEGSAFTAAVASVQNNEAAVTSMVLGSRILISNSGLDPQLLFDEEVSVIGDGQITGTLLSVSGNAIGATASANKAHNLLAAYDFASLSLGTSTPDLYVGGQGFANVSTDAKIIESEIEAGWPSLLPIGGGEGNFLVFNNQWNQGDVGASVGFDLLRLKELDEDDDLDELIDPVSVGVLINGDLFGTPIAVEGNSVTASAVGNDALNQLLVDGVSILSDDLTMVGTLVNLQGNAGDIAAVTMAEVGISVIGQAETVAGIVEDAMLSVQDNTIAAGASGNAAVNALEASSMAHGLLGEDDILDPIQNGAGLGAADPYLAAAYALLSVQTNSGDVSAETVGSIGVGLDLLGEAGQVSDTIVAIDGNTLSAQARGNAVQNSILLDATVVADSASLLNQQINLGSTQAAVLASSIGLTAADGSEDGYDFDHLALSIQDNAIRATAVSNTAANSLTVSGTVIGGLPGGATANYTGPTDTMQVIADFTLLNSQRAEGEDAEVTAEILGADIGFSTDGGIGFEEGPSTLAVSGNSLGATALINNASNTLTLQDATVASASAAIANAQVSSQSAGAFVGLGGIGLDTGEIIEGAVLNVAGNSALAAAGGNSASNVLNVVSTVGLGSYGASAEVDAASAFAAGDHALYNYQENGGPINAAVGGLQVGVGAPTLASVSVAVNSNQVAAQAIGNSASNSVTLANLPGTGPSAALTSIQVNTASVSATVSGVWVGATGGLGSGGVASVNGNAVGATAIGNSVSNSIKSGSGF